MCSLMGRVTGAVGVPVMPMIEEQDAQGGILFENRIF